MNENKRNCRFLAFLTFGTIRRSVQSTLDLHAVVRRPCNANSFCSRRAC